MEQTKTENNSQINVKKNGGNLPLMIGSILVLAVLVVAAGYYWMNAPAPNTPENKPITQDNSLTSPAAKAMLDAYAKQQNFSAPYSLEYTENTSDGSKIIVSLIDDGKNKYATAIRVISRRQVYLAPNETIVCEKNFAGKENCAKLGENSSLQNYTIGIDSLFLSFDPTAKSADSTLIKMGVLEFTQEPQEAQVANRKCTLVRYTLDYTKLNATQLALLGMESNDTLRTVFGNFSASRCFDAKTGVVLDQHLQYVYLKSNQTMAYDKIFSSFETENIKISVPEVNVDEKKLQTSLQEMDAVIGQIEECTASNAANLSKCVMISAIDRQSVEICQAADSQQGKDNCALNYALRTMDANGCEKAGEMKDECYVNYAYTSSDDSYCTLVMNESLKSECVKIVAEGLSSTNTTSESTPKTTGSEQVNITKSGAGVLPGAPT
ncbi:MAG: hypothetical protein WC492_00120 [Candidatus Micrarchaeia archaeon]